jgi:hypothetical protein
MTYNNNHNVIEDLPPSDLDIQARPRVTGYQSPDPSVIDTGVIQLESPTVKDVIAEREDNPFLRLAVVSGVFGIVVVFLWGIFAFVSPKAPKIVETPEEVETTPAEIEPDYQAKLAFRDQFHSLEKKQNEALEVEVNSELPSVPVPQSTPPLPVSDSVARPIPQPAPPRPISIPNFTDRALPRPIARLTESTARSQTVLPLKVDPQEKWTALADFGTGISSRQVSAQTKTMAKRHNTSTDTVTSTNEQITPPALLLNRVTSQGELGILNRQTQASFPQPAPKLTLNRGIAKAKIELPLVWDSSLTTQEQQSSQLTVVLAEPLLDLTGQTVFESGSVAIIQVQSINDANGLVTAYVSQINDTTFSPGEMILRNSKKSALVAKASKRSDFGDQLLAGGIDTLSNFGTQLLIPETTSVISNGSAVVTNQSRNNIGRDLVGSALDGFGSTLNSELQQRNTRNQIGDGGTIYTLSPGETVYLTNIRPIIINP